MDPNARRMRGIILIAFGIVSFLIDSVVIQTVLARQTPAGTLAYLYAGCGVACGVLVLMGIALLRPSK